MGRLIWPQVVDSTADSLKRTQRAADDARQEIETPPAPAPFAATPLTSLPAMPKDKDTPVRTLFSPFNSHWQRAESCWQSPRLHAL